VRLRNDGLSAQAALLRLRPGDSLEVPATPVAVPVVGPGQEILLEVPLLRAGPALDHRHPLAWNLEVEGLHLTGDTHVPITHVPYARPVIDGDLSEWQDRTWTTIQRPGPYADWATTTPSMTMDGGYRLALAWDERGLHLAARIPDRTSRRSTTATDLEYRIAGDDRLTVALALPGEAVDDLLTKHPLHRKCLTSDLTHEFATQLSETGPELLCLVTPGSGYQGLVPGNRLPRAGMGPLAGAAVMVRYDEASRCLLHEATIPWSALPTLQQRLTHLAEGGLLEIPLSWMVTDQHRWASHTRFDEELGHLEPAANGIGPRIGTPCWSNDTPVRLRIPWGFTR
jgi:hypothetical protein